MSGGLFAVDRGVFEHRMFANEPYTEREAWMWLISEAAWKAKSIRTPHGMVRVERGQLVHSQRFLAAKWQWDRSRVRRFFELLESEKMIAQERPSFDPAKGPASTQQKAQKTAQLTICNYEKYQFGGPSDGPSSVEKTTQRTDQKRPKEEELITKKEKIEDRGADAPPDNVVPISRQYAFEGRVIKLHQAGLDRWKQTYHSIPDMPAVLQLADDYYSENPPKGGKWFFPVSKWLEKEHLKILAERETQKRSKWAF
jgi:hypothetical protein